MSRDTEDITVLLHQWQKGDEQAERQLIEKVYPMMREIARRQLRSERMGMTLAITDLVNEAYLRLVGHTRMNWQDRGHFLAIVATVVRRILIDYAKAKNRQKRGGDAVTVSLHHLREHQTPRTAQEFDVLALHEAMEGLAQVDANAEKVVRLRYFAGLELKEVSEVLNRSVSSITRDWQFARAWLHRRLKQ